MHWPNGRASIATCALCLTLSLSAGCADAPVVSGDTYCERARHISATDGQLAIIRPFFAQLRSWLDQIAANNDTYDANCIAPASDPRGKSK